MEERTLPGTELSLSVVGLGCWAIGGRWWGDDIVDETSVEAIHAALDEGINWFDTAPLYGYGHADEVLVKALGEKKRDVVIATKVGVRWDGEGEHASSDLTPDYIVEDTENSLTRLGVETIDLLQVHWPCEKDTPLEDSLEALTRLQEAGKIRHFGLCNYDAETLARARELAPIVSLQTPVSMVRREYEHELAPVVTGTDGGRPLGALAYEPLVRGLLTGKFADRPDFPETDLRRRDDRFQPGAFERINRLTQGLVHIGKHFELPAGALAIAWVARRAGMTSVIAGAKRPDQVRQNALGAAALEKDLPWDVLDEMAGAVRF